MAIAYTVKPGDYLARIAKAHGFPDWRVIWNHPDNAELKKKRGNPNVLYAGDLLQIPDLQGKQVDGATDQRHRFKLSRQPLKLVLALVDLHRQNVANADCVLSIDGQQTQLTTDAKGRVEVAIPHDAATGRLSLVNPRTGFPEQSVDFRIGHLDPLDTPEGQRQRLDNLGYFAGPFEDRDEAENALLLRSAIEEFQCDQNLYVDGLCGPATQAKLKELHGC